VLNEFSGTAHAVAQIGQQIGNIVYNLPPVPPIQTTVPHEVPAVDPLFTDREEALGVLLGEGMFDDSGTVSIAVVVGPEGVGKTAFTRRVSAQASGRFPGGELHVDFQSVTYDATASMGEALARCLHGLGVDRQFQPAALADRVAMYRTRTSAHRVLVVLDDITEPAHVRTLIPTAPGSLLLATSSRVLEELIAADGARMLRLGPLDDAHSRQLLARMCGPQRFTDDPTATADLVRFCDGLPIALRLAGAHLAQDPELGVRDLLHVIEDAGMARLDALMTAAYSALSEEAQQAFRLIGAAGLPAFDVRAIAALLDVPDSRARTVVRALSDANLVIALGRRRYRLLTPAARYADETADRETLDAVDAALGRVLEFFLALALFADHHVLAKSRLRLFDPAPMLARHEDPFSSAVDAEDWLTDDWAAVLAVLQRGAQRGLADPVWQLAEVASALSLNTRRPADQIRICRIGKDAATAAGRLDVRARLNIIASRGYIDMGRLDEARTALDEALADAERVGDLALLASVHEFRGRFLELSDPEAAAAAYRISLELNTRAGERRGAALAAFFLAGVTPATTAERYEQLVSEFLGLDDERMASRVRVRLAEQYARRGDLFAAAVEAGEAARFFAERKAGHYEAQALEVLAGIAEQARQVDAARNALDRVAAILDARADPRADDVRRRRDALHSSAVRPRPASE
jgi:hypothetical protein